ncbi:MFS transporter [Streptomyces sp. S.PNR 29]|uniref:MFS transporter n=1 Tax=Streptomyces sp. S.PNR 29 TaxID=2973805 RepID=UPI0025B1686D|nr:MFS transporter [Streptomyces sp. S.PNR 29]MDN0198373.1 MFS transporter [Streptomyces sp. S.PNR 29]
MGGVTLTQDEPAVAPPEMPARDRAAPLSPRRVRLLFAGLTLALVLAALEQMVVATALPTIVGELHGLDRMSWTITAYLLAATVALPVCGAFGDRLGRKGVFQFATVVFVAGSALSGRAQTMDQLIAYRAVQGAGAGGLMIGVQAIAADIVPPGRHGRCGRLLGGAFGLASVAGPLLGGHLTDHLSWRWCFYVNVPFGLLTLALVTVGPKLPKPEARPRLDIPGAVLLAAVSTCLVLLAGWGGREYAWDSRVILGLGAGAVVAGALFLVAEHLAAQPLIPLRLFRDSAFNVTGLVGLVTGVALFGTAGYLPTFLQMADGVSATESGLLMLPMTGGMVGASVIAGQLIRRTGRYKVHPILGGVLSSAGMWLLSGLDADTPRLQYCIWTALLGAGVGMVMPVLILAVQNSVRPADLSTATGATTYFRQIGGSVGAAAVGTLFVGRLTEALAEHLPPRAGVRLPDPGSLTPELVHALPPALRDGYVRAYADAMPRIFLHLVPVLVLGLLIAFFLKEKPLVSHDDPADETENATPNSTIPQARSPYVAGVPVCGTVRNPDGTAVPRAALTLVDVTGQQVGRSVSGEDGRYALITPGPGPYILIAAAGGHQPQAVSVTMGERPLELDLVLGGAARLTGSVLSVGGTPVRDATVTLTNAHGEVVASTRSGREGWYAITDLLAGEYTLAAGAPARAYRPAALPVTVQAARETRQDIRLTGGAVLRGTARAGGGRPVEDARVTLLDAAGNVVDTVTTSVDGSFRFVGLSGGEYTVVAAGYPPATSVLRLAGEECIERDLQLGHQD